MNFASTLNDDNFTMPAGVPALGAVRASTPQAPSNTQQPQQPVVAVVPAQTRYDYGGATPRPRTCCPGTRQQMPVINLNINAGNNNGNANGSANGSAGGAQTPGGRLYNDSPQMSQPEPEVRIERVEVPKIVERLVYKPLTMVREKIKKLVEYKPMQQVYERRVGKVYDDRPQAFEGVQRQS